MTFPHLKQARNLSLVWPNFPFNFGLAFLSETAPYHLRAFSVSTHKHASTSINPTGHELGVVWADPLCSSGGLAERLPLTARVTSWVIVPPRWAEMTVGCDFCNLQNAPRFALLVLLLTAVIFASQTLVSCTGQSPGRRRWMLRRKLRSVMSLEVCLFLHHAVSLSWQAKDGPGAFQYL